MSEQLGPRKLWAELQQQAPQYAKILPQLPVLLQTYLQRPSQDAAQQAALLRLLAQQQKTHRLLQGALWAVAGFLMGVVLTAALGQLRLWH